jgi:hypothetical protein
MSETSKAKRKQSAHKGKAGADGKDELRISTQPGKSEEWGLAEVALDPAAHALSIAEPFNRGSFGKRGVTETYEVLTDQLKGAKRGELSHYRSMLAGQAISLDSIFTELSRRAALNMGEYIQATETYMRLALKAQAQSRATIEALERLANGREQTVRHVHVDNRGGQAVIAENVQTGGQKNGEIDDQSQATAAAGVGSALPGPDPFGNGVPIPSRKRAEAVPHARGD